MAARWSALVMSAALRREARAAKRSVPLSLAAESQHRLLPGAFTCEAGQCTVAGWLEPAGEIAGNTFDFALERDTLHLSMTDAMAYSVEAALLATVVVGALRDHAERVGRRLEELGEGAGPLPAVVGVAENVVGQALALGKAPFDLVRGTGGEEKVLKNAKDTCATEALEIATYTALERLARSVDDGQTATLAASILVDEQKMLDRVLREIPKLTDAVVGAELEGKPSYDVTTTGAAAVVRDAGDATKQAARKTSAATRRTARTARKVPGVAQVEGQVKGAVASEADLAISRYDALTVQDITGRLPGLSQIDLAKIDSYERRNQKRTTILSRISSLRGNEPWPGYDELTAADVQGLLAEGDEDRAKQVRSYERSHKNRVGVLSAAQREHSNA